MKVTTGFQYPHPLFVYPTRRCNYACSYCFTESDPSRSPTSFVLNHWDYLMEQARDLSVSEIRISGGEPLLIRALKQLCDTVARLGIRYTVTTNGSLLRRHLKWMVENPPDTIWLSFHAEYATWDQFVAQVAEAASRLPTVGVNLFDVDLVAYPELAARTAEAGARRIKVVHRTPIGRCLQSVPPSPWQHTTIAALTDRWKNRFSKAVEVRVEAPTLASAPAGKGTCVLRERPLLSIDHDGAIYPCCVTVGSVSTAIGNLQSESLEMIACRANSTVVRQPCAELLPLISAGQRCCPLRLVAVPLSREDGETGFTSAHAFGTFWHETKV